jgi:hypothetical protein
LAPDLALAPRPAPPVSESRSTWLQVTAADLERGVAIDTTASGAVIRVNPLDPVEVVLDPARFVIVDPSDRVLVGGSAMETLVTADQLAASDIPFPAGTAAFRMRAELGDGRFILRTHDLGVDGSSRFVVHLFEPASPVVARLAGSSAVVLAGDSIEVEATLWTKDERVATDLVEAQLISPAGRRTPVRLGGRGGAWVGRVRVGDALPGKGLWEVEVRLRAVVGERPVQRTVRTAFAVAAATARLDGRVELVDRDGLMLRLGLETAAAGRYELRGILWGTTESGSLAPVAVAHSAANLGAGRGEIELGFTEELLAGSKTRAPYELRDLQLVDQSRMGVLHRQARALVID